MLMALPLYQSGLVSIPLHIHAVVVSSKGNLNLWQ